MKKAFSLKRLSSAFKYAFKGFGKVYKNEDNMKVHVVVAILVVLCGFLFKVSTLEWIILIFAIGLVIGAEVLNTCIENLLLRIIISMQRMLKILLLLIHLY